MKSPAIPCLTSLPATLVKDNKLYLVTSTDGKGGILQDPASDVSVIIPDGLCGTLKGHIETDPTDYLHAIGTNDCLIAPIPDFTFERKDTLRPKPRFKIRMKHALKSMLDLVYIRVKHGDIHKGQPFRLIPRKPWNGSEDVDIMDMYWEADREYITITTSHFSQFVCTSCKMTCGDDLQVFVYGNMKDVANDKIADLKVFLCPMLFKILDFKEVSPFSG